MSDETTTTEQEVAKTEEGSEESKQTEEGKDSSTEESTEETTEEKTGAPDEYKFEAPEGVEYDADVITKFSEAVKVLDLNQEQATGLLEKLAPAIAKSQQDQVAKAQADWVDQAKNDSEIGGEKFEENLSIAKKGMEAIGNEKLTSLLNESGLGNHPEVIRMFHKIGGMVGEDGFISSDVGTTKDTGPITDARAASKMYDHETSKQT